ncbi:UDP-N-acetylmuramate dehydrogenase [Agriterribacter sp.]|uniref:UDP-N-acetylmuramate dehydrogenase n=1 Tax=Agriterribacter sp. TaxID=2821509 RepID=UPI002C17DEF8|nr:UDP-N-acetylmuramate dehydrogenase [Agriterribacter sp.]HTN07560.1 UDP-N-acetylmuramate dehydrogenase [Agriterribacter sp.]
MQIRENISLRQYNTFGIDVRARYFSAFAGIDTLAAWMEKNPKVKRVILGGGSNILFTKNVDGIVLKNEIVGIDEIKEDDTYVYVRAGAGENWHRFVQYCIQRNWAGLENLSLIPGSVGAAPMQNIGAYGVELQEVFNSLSAYHLHDKKVHNFTAGDCAFGYRESVFKKQYKDQFIILNVTFRLRKHPVFHTSYGAIREELEKMQVGELSIQAIAQAVINIRSSKLPDPAVIGNAGSFFKNPEIPQKQFEVLQKTYPAIPHYPARQYAVSGSDDQGFIKLAAGWLIEQCGWKGFRRGDAGVHVNQSLVLVNYGKATGKEIYNLSGDVLHSVHKKFGILLEREVNIV